MIEMKIYGLALDEQTQVPLLILKDKEAEQQVLPIWIGAMEAMSISISLNQVEVSRPLTHDLLLNLLGTLEAKIQRVVVTDLKEGTYYAEIHMEHSNQTYLVDSRPSDAVALAVRAQAPIFASQDLLEQVGKRFAQQEHEVGLQDEEAKKWTEILERFDAEDTKYKM
ncbi:MAG: bifunctional nuclease family protein [Desulfohalobiaceae bacterium]